MLTCSSNHGNHIRATFRSTEVGDSPDFVASRTLNFLARVAQMQDLLKLSTLPETGVEALDDDSVDLGQFSEIAITSSD